MATMLSEMLAIADVDEDTGFWVRCVRATFGDYSLELDLELDQGWHSQDGQLWHLACLNVREHTVELSGCELELRESDPLLMPYQAERASLSFKGLTTNVDAVIGALWRTHHGFFGDCIPFGKFLSSYPLADLLSGGFGQLADGPVPLIEAFADVLLANKIACHVQQYGKPGWHGPDGWTEEVGSAKMLVIGQGYVIAERFEATRPRL